MKLLDKSTRYYLMYSLFVFAVGSVFFYFSIQQVIYDGIDEALHQEKIVFVNNLKYEKQIDSLVLNEVTSIQRLGTSAYHEYDKYYTIKPTADSTIEENYRQIESVFKHDGVYYLLKMKQSLVEEEELIQSIVPVGIVMFMILLVGILAISNFISVRIWTPFYGIIDQLRTYDIKKGDIVEYQKMAINEFDRLSHDLYVMTSKINEDYKRQKEFNENFSHELQTPLAIIQNNLEIMIQSPNLKDAEMENVASIMEAVKRLSNINRGLILLAQLDNNQYQEEEQLELNAVVDKIIGYFKIKLNDKKVLVTKEYGDRIFIKINPILLDIFITNIISNAIKHNVENGYLTIAINNNELLFSNSGVPLNGDPQKIFDRFKKFGHAKKSVGLGMAIVKKICDVYAFKITYKTIDDRHEISIVFS
jgi:signal transduction histidine kinase